ncbi:OmpA family protein [Orrella sp. 11846]|uniref:OmpA family protein n=1 Tax=Orrella sp. 11846 TaxID=3409913 RepID=UPI003B5C2536
MRASFKRRHTRETDEESVFVSMTDMTVSFLFIVMLLLAFFANQYDPDKSVSLPEHQRVLSERDALTREKNQLTKQIEELTQQIVKLKELLAKNETIQGKLKQEIVKLEQKILELEQEILRLKTPDPLEIYINQSLAERRRILEELQHQLLIDFPDLEVVLSEESDALRFQGDGLFRSGQAGLRPDRRDFIETVAQRLEQILPCYTLGSNSNKQTECNSGFALIEAIQIEGHTDSDGNDIMNLGLSTARANETFRVMTQHEPGLIEHLNFRSQPVLSVAGYGKMRPVSSNNSPEGKAANRRIDLRIIMYVPVNSDQIETVREALIDGKSVDP